MIRDLEYAPFLALGNNCFFFFFFFLSNFALRGHWDAEMIPSATSGRLGNS